MLRLSASLLVLLIVTSAPANAQSIWERARDAASSAIGAGVEAVRKDVQRRSSAAINGLLGDSTAAPAASGAAFRPGATLLYEPGGEAGRAPDGLHVWGGDITLTDGGDIEVASSGAFDVVLDEGVPAAFTVEFDLIMSGAAPFVQVAVTDESGEPVGASYAIIDGESGMALGSDSGGDYVAEEIVGADRVAVRLAVDGSDARLYLGDALVASASDAAFGTGPRLQFVIDGVADAPVQIVGLRVATD